MLPLLLLCHDAAIADTTATAAAMLPLVQVSGIETFGGPERHAYFREAALGLNRLAYLCVSVPPSLMLLLLPLLLLSRSAASRPSAVQNAL
jgi:hypothetical protein